MIWDKSNRHNIWLWKMLAWCLVVQECLPIDYQDRPKNWGITILQIWIEQVIAASTDILIRYPRCSQHCWEFWKHWFVHPCVSADKWPVARADEDQRKCKRNIFVLSCYKEWAQRLIFNYNLSDLSMSQCLDNCVGEFMTAHQSIFHSTYNIHFAHQSIICITYNIQFAHQSIFHSTYNIHFAHQSIFHSTYDIHFAHQSIFHKSYKHSFCTPRHMTYYIQTFIFIPKYTIHNISYCMSFIDWMHTTCRLWVPHIPFRCKFNNTKYGCHTCYVSKMISCQLLASCNSIYSHPFY